MWRNKARPACSRPARGHAFRRITPCINFSPKIASVVQENPRDRTMIFAPEPNLKDKNIARGKERHQTVLHKRPKARDTLRTRPRTTPLANLMPLGSCMTAPPTSTHYNLLCRKNSFLSVFPSFLLPLFPRDSAGFPSLYSRSSVKCNRSFIKRVKRGNRPTITPCRMLPELCQTRV